MAPGAAEVGIQPAVQIIRARSLPRPLVLDHRLLRNPQLRLLPHLKLRPLRQRSLLKHHKG